MLTGVSVAIVQYLFSNHQAGLKNILSSLKKIEFDKGNQYDLALEKQWEDTISECRKHTYFMNPNISTLFGFMIIVSLAFVYVVVSWAVIVDLKIDDIYIEILVFVIGVVLFSWLVANSIVLKQIFKKESDIKSEFNQIESQHKLVEKILNKK